MPAAPASKTVTLPSGEQVQVPEVDTAPPAPPAAPAAIAAIVDGAHGMDSAANFLTLYNAVVAMRAAMVAHGWWVGP